MATKTVGCPACGEPVPYGRLSCPSCGTILAAVAGNPRTTPGEPAPPPGPKPIPSILGDWTGPAPASDASFGVELAAARAEASGPPPQAFAPPPPPPSAAPAVTEPPAGRPLRPGHASLLADLPFDAPSTLPGWLVTGGAIIASIGFFLPWAHLVIGAGSFGTYVGSWGFANLIHLPAFLLALVTVVLAVLPNGVPAWFRSGVLPIAVGGLIGGLVWIYLTDGSNGLFGAWAEGVAAVLLVVGGGLAVRADRHAVPPDRV